MREISGGNNYVSQNPTEQHFGLNDVSSVDEVRVRWPDGSETSRTGLAPNQRIVVRYPDEWSTD